MAIRENNAKSLLRKQKRIDAWFVSRYGMNLYRGCAHDCAYCDGRSERYYVAGEFGKDITVKKNAAGVLDRELDPARKRKPFKRSFLLLGGGVGDCYQPVEARFGLARQLLKVIERRRFPVHVLTKSSLVERDLDVLRDINGRTRALVSMSFSSVDDRISRVFEPGSTPPSRRLETLRRMKQAGLSTGMFLLPVIPGVTDSLGQIDRAVGAARQAGVDFVQFGGMTLKEGSQSAHFLEAARRFDPDLAPRIEFLYPGNKWGNPRSDYSDSINQAFDLIARRHRVAQRIPTRLYVDILDPDDRVVVVLQNLDHFMRLQGNSSPYGFAAHAISRLNEPLAGIRNRLREIRGVGKTTEKIIKEVLDTGACSYLDGFFP